MFLLQYLTCQEEKEYRETELVFNRLLVGLPMHIPLPKRLELTAEEKQIADSLLSAVKAQVEDERNIAERISAKLCYPYRSLGGTGRKMATYRGLTILIKLVTRFRSPGDSGKYVYRG